MTELLSQISGFYLFAYLRPCSLGCPELTDSPVSASLVLGLKACSILHGWMNVEFFKNLVFETEFHSAAQASM